MQRLIALAVALALVAGIPVAPIASPTYAAEQSVKYRNATGMLVRLYAEQPCSPAMLKQMGVIDGAFYRRALVYFGNDKVEACWLTAIADGSVYIAAENLMEFAIPISQFRPEDRA